MADGKDRDLRVSLKPLSGEEALRALLQVDPESEAVEDDPAPAHGDSLSAAASRDQQGDDQREGSDH
jgi:hypothetical protein